MKRGHILIFLGMAVVLILIPVILCLSGIWIPNRPSQDDYPVRGIDVSHHQGDIDWPRVAASGIRFAYIKATEGSSYDDPDFKKNWEAASSARIAHGAYHFYTIGTPGKVQAAHFLSRVPVDASALPPAIDIELTGNNSSVEAVAQFQRDLAEFMDILAAHYGKKPLVYTSRDFRERYLKGMQLESWWLSDIIFTPKQSPGYEWKLWQFSWRGRVSGVASFVDLDVYSGSQKDFEMFVGSP